MKRRLLVALGFCTGLGAALLSNAVVSGEMKVHLNAERPMKALQASVTQWQLAGVATAEAAVADAYTTVNRCLGGSTERVANPSGNSSRRIPLLKHVPPPPSQRLDWYRITHGAAIANAPRVSAPEPAITHWQVPVPEPVRLAESCAVGLDDAIAQAPTAPAQIDQTHQLLLQQQAHFILSLVTLTQDSDWLLQPSPQASQVVHRMWRVQAEPEYQANLKIATKPETATDDGLVIELE